MVLSAVSATAAASDESAADRFSRSPLDDVLPMTLPYHGGGHRRKAFGSTTKCSIFVPQHA
jgi:hypothetical protein